MKGKNGAKNTKCSKKYAKEVRKAIFTARRIYIICHYVKGVQGKFLDSCRRWDQKKVRESVGTKKVSLKKNCTQKTQGAHRKPSLIHPTPLTVFRQGGQGIVD